MGHNAHLSNLGIFISTEHRDHDFNKLAFILLKNLHVKFSFFVSVVLKKNKMCCETQMPIYKANFKGGHHRQTSRSAGQKLWYQEKGLVIRNTHMKYKSPINYHSKDMINVKVAEK
jgi:hypothetical protein